MKRISSAKGAGMPRDPEEYDIRAEDISGAMSFDPVAGTLRSESRATRIKYRKKGTRSRFKSFVVVGPLQGTLREIVEAYEKGEADGTSNTRSQGP